MMAPDGKMRGPTTVPSSMARLSPNAGPPTSRTVVNPRISVSVASAPATRLRWPMSPASRSAGVVRTSIVCQCMSISPGISVRPPPSMRTVSARRSVGTGAAEIFSILLPRTWTLEGAERLEEFPSKMRTFWNRTTGTADAAGSWAGACAKTTDAAKRQAATSPHFAMRNDRERSLSWVMTLSFGALQRLQGALVDLAVLHDHDEVLRRIGHRAHTAQSAPEP